MFQNVPFGDKKISPAGHTVHKAPGVEALEGFLDRFIGDRMSPDAGYTIDLLHAQGV